MKNYYSIIAVFALLLFTYSCGTDAEIDKEKPVIDLSIDGAYPQNCGTLYFGESFVLKVKFSDNEELGSYSIDIHHNFDHHSHSTEAEFESCGDYEADKSATNPFTFIDDYEIPEGRDEYITDLNFTIPSTNSDGEEYQTGDYHLHISLTDKQGWSAQKGLNVKILRR